MQFQTVLCPVDLTPISERAIELATAVSQKLHSRLILEHNLDSPPPSTLGVSWMWSGAHKDSDKTQAELATERLQKWVSGIPASLRPEAKLTRGSVVETLLYLASNLPAELMVMGTHGKSSPEHASLTEKIIIKASCPVLTIGESYDPASVFDLVQGMRGEDLNVVIPIDFKKKTHTALRFGTALAERMPHRMILVHVLGDGKGSEQEEEAARTRLREMVPPGFEDRVTLDVRRGAPAAGIIEATSEHSAIFVILAAHGKSPLRRVLFSETTNAVLHGCDCPVLFIPPHARAWES